MRLGLEFLGRRKAIRTEGQPAKRLLVTDNDMLRFYARSIDRTL